MERRKAVNEKVEDFPDLLLKQMSDAPVRNRKCQASHHCLGVITRWLPKICLLFVIISIAVIFMALYLNLTLKDKCVAPPSIPSATFPNVTNSSLTTVWTYPNSSDNSVHGYLVKLVDDKQQLLEKISTVENQHTFRSLHPYTLYHVDVAAYRVYEGCPENTMYSFQANASVRTAPGVPSIPGHHRVENIASESVEFTWEKPHIPNGPINGYVVSFGDLTSSREGKVLRTNFAARGLKPWTTYRFSVSAFNTFNGTALVGPSITFQAKTLVSTPNAPTNFIVKDVTTSTVALSWHEPEPPNGPLNGYILNNLNEIPPSNVTITDTTYTFGDLKPFTEYTFTVKAFNVLQGSSLIGPEETVVVKTKIGLPSVPTDIVVKDVTSSSVVLTWEEPEFPNGPLSGYVLNNLNEVPPTNVTVTETTYTFSDLKPFTEYTFTVRAFNTFQESSLIGPEIKVEVTTSVAPPSVPTNFIVTDVTTSAVVLSWDEPESPNGLLNGYVLNNLNEIPPTNVTITDTTYTFGDLKPFTEYTFTVKAFNLFQESSLIGPEETVVVKTKMGLPSVPTDVVVKDVTSSSVVLTWEEPESPNGPLSGYILNNLNEVPPTNVTVTETTYTFNDLKPFTKYTFAVKAFNTFQGSSLIGPEITVEAETSVGSPSAPAKPRIGKVTSSSVQVLWRRPETPNGPIDGYTVECVGDDVTPAMTTMETSVVFNNLKPFTEYMFYISAFNRLSSSSLSGPRVSIEGRTAGLPPPFPVKRLSVESTGQNTAIFSIPLDLFSNENGPIVEYMLLVAKSGFEGRQIQQQGHDTVNKASFQRWQPSMYNDVWYRASTEDWNPHTDRRYCEDTYISTKRRCTIGSDSHCSRRYCNAPLNSDTTYWVKIRAYTDFGWTETYPERFRTDPEPRRENISPSHGRRTSGFSSLKPAPGIVILFISFIFMYIFK